MNCHDVVLLTKSEPKTAALQPLRAKCVELETFVTFAGRFLTQERRHDMWGERITFEPHFADRGEIIRVRDLALQAINKERQMLVMSTGTLVDLAVPPLQETLDVWGQLSQTPKTTTASIRELCDALGFIIIPMDYLDPRSYKDEDRSVREQITLFAKLDGLQAYVLCPIAHYSMDRHVHAQDPNLPIYAGRHQQTFMSVQMAIPALRTIVVDLEAMKSQMKGIESRMQSAENNMQMLARLLQDVQRQVQEQQRQIALERADRAVRDKIRRLEVTRFSALEPMAFTVREDADILTGSELAFVGPCWGPDFEEIVFTALRLAKKKGQRKEIVKRLRKAWNGIEESEEKDDWRRGRGLGLC